MRGPNTAPSNKQSQARGGATHSKEASIPEMLRVRHPSSPTAIDTAWTASGTRLGQLAPLRRSHECSESCTPSCEDSILDTSYRRKFPGPYPPSPPPNPAAALIAHPSIFCHLNPSTGAQVRTPLDSILLSTAQAPAKRGLPSSPYNSHTRTDVGWSGVESYTTAAVTRFHSPLRDQRRAAFGGSGQDGITLYHGFRESLSAAEENEAHRPPPHPPHTNNQECISVWQVLCGARTG